MRVFADVQQPTVLRSAILGLEATVYPGINEFDDDEFANALILQGAVLPVPDEPLVTAKNNDGSPKTDGEHEPHYAPIGQGLRLDLESARKGKVVDRASALAHNRALAAENDLDGEAEKARGIALAQAALADPDKDGVFHAEIRKTPVVGTEAAHRLDLSDDEKNEEIKARSLGISKATQQALGSKRKGGSSGSSSSSASSSSSSSSKGVAKGASAKKRAEKKRAERKRQPQGKVSRAVNRVKSAVRRRE